MPDGKDESKFFWASIAGARPEPIEVTTLDGRRVAYTCGCADPFDLDAPDCPVEIEPARCMINPGLVLVGTPFELRRPNNWRKSKRAYEKYQADPSHGWRGPR